MVNHLLDSISSPQDLKNLSHPQLRILAEDLRAEMIAATSQVGGHLAPSLGCVEIILAAHRLMNCPKDKLLFDVGHQAYAHKLLTGRRDAFFSLRQYKGISGFPKRKESPYDVHDSGHASDSLATALGLALARDLDGEDYRILTVIGDASITGGLAFEALNQIGSLKKRMVIVLNDNEMSISPTVGAFTHYLSQLRADQRYIRTRKTLSNAIENIPHVGETLMRGAYAARESVKQALVPGMFFEELGIKYFGPIDGHNISVLEESMAAAFEMDGPVLIHAVTKKGRGFLPAEDDPMQFHGTPPFDAMGKPAKTTSAGKKKPISYTSAFSQQLIKEAHLNTDIVAITAAMPSGTGLDAFEKVYPRRFLDVGIAEECAVTTASGLAIGGKLPVVAIYSTFLQRGFDEIVTNVCEPNLHVVFAVDRAGLVGEDGPTHHGAFDMSWLRCMPNMRILVPSDEAELSDAVHTAIGMRGPVAIRFPRGSAQGVALSHERTKLVPGVARKLLVTKPDDAGAEQLRVALLGIGRMAYVAKAAAQALEVEGIACTVYDARWLKPIDHDMVADAASHDLIVTVEEGNVMGGFSAAVLESLADQGLVAPVERCGIDDVFVEQGAIQDLLAECGLTAEQVADRVRLGLAKLSGTQ